jgi:hypothetical protein
MPMGACVTPGVPKTILAAPEHTFPKHASDAET